MTGPFVVKVWPVAVVDEDSWIPPDTKVSSIPESEDAARALVARFHAENGVGASATITDAATGTSWLTTFTRTEVAS